MEVEAFQPLVYALDGYIVSFAVILWILLPELVKCNQVYKCQAKKYTPIKMIDSILAIVIYRSRENLAHAIFYQGKLSERTGRKATGLKERCRCSVSLFSTKFFALSKPGCRDGLSYNKDNTYMGNPAFSFYKYTINHGKNWPVFLTIISLDHQEVSHVE